MEPISAKAKAARASGTRQTSPEAQKRGPSKFDLLRSDLNQKLSSAVQLPPKVTGITDGQKQILENDLRRKLETGRSPHDVLGGEMKQLRSEMTDLGRKVSAVPQGGIFAPIRERFKSIEADFHASARLLNQSGSLDDPQRLLQMQMEMYKLAHNVEILSKTVSETASCVKTILQTQV